MIPSSGATVDTSSTRDGERENIVVAWDPPELDEEMPPRPHDESRR